MVYPLLPSFAYPISPPILLYPETLAEEDEFDFERDEDDFLYQDEVEDTEGVETEDSIVEEEFSEMEEE